MERAEDQINFTNARLCAWAGVAWFALFAIGFVIFLKMMPATPAYWTRQEVAHFYQENRIGILIGCAICAACQGLGFVWSGGMAAWTAKCEGKLPFLSFGQLACISFSFGGAIIGLVAWASAAYRPGLDPQIIQLLNDQGWFWMTFITNCSAMQAILMGLAILSDKRANPIFPRWMGYFQTWMGILQIQGALVIFFTEGPFAYHGLFDYYVPFTVFFAWVVVGVWGQLRAIKRVESGELIIS